jgi:hypothetical protein
MDSPNEKVIEEFKKAQAWFSERYGKTFDIHERYDRKEKKWSWRLVANIGGEDRIIALGLSAATAENEVWFNLMKSKVLDYVKQCLIKAMAKFEPETQMKV